MTKRIGLIGCGKWGQYLLRDLKQLQCHVTAVCRSAQSRSNAEKGQADRIVDTVAQLKDIDGIVIASATYTHADMIRQAMHYNVPIFVEKPLTCDVADAEQLVAAYGDKLFIMDKWRYHPGIIKLAEMVRNEELGSLIGIKTVRYATTNHHADVDMVWTLLPHDLMIVYELLGTLPKPKHAIAHEIGKETVSLTCLLGNSPWVLMSSSSIYPKTQREILIECTHGLAVLRDGYAEQVEVYRHDNPRSEQTTLTDSYSLAKEMPTLTELRAFINYLDGGPAPKSSAQEGLMVVKAIDEIRQLAGIKHSGLLQ